jgi:hypothetical protein
MGFAKQLFLIIMTMFLVASSGSAQMLGPEVKPQKLKNCFVYHLRNLDTYASADLKEVCSAPRGWSPDSHNFVFTSRAIMAFYNAEIAYCGAAGCASVGKDMRLVLVGDPLPNIFIAPAKAREANEPDSITIIVTTTLVDFVLRNAHALMNDLLEDEQLKAQGYQVWLDQLRALGGRSCSLPVTWNTVTVSPKLTEDILTRTAMTTFQFLFAHELAHLLLKQTCGYKVDQTLTLRQNAQGIERACDKTAFAQLAKSEMAMPLLPIATLVAWEHYITLKRPQLIRDFPGGETKFVQAFPVLDLKDRSQLLLDQLQAVCSSSPNRPMCAFWQDFRLAAKRIIESPPPTPCNP